MKPLQDLLDLLDVALDFAWSDGCHSFVFLSKETVDMKIVLQEAITKLYKETNHD